MRLNGNLVLNPLGQSEIQNVVIERVASLPVFDISEKGRVVFNTTTNVLYVNDGSIWSPLAAASGVNTVAQELDALESALGTLINSDGTFKTSELSNYTNLDTSGVTTLSGLLGAINAKFGALVTTLSGQSDVAFTSLTNKDVLYYDSTSSTWKNAQPGATSGVQRFDSDLDALAALSGTGIVVRTGAGTAATRTIQGSADVSVSNGDGVTADPSLSLSDTGVTAGTYTKVTVDGKGRVTVGASVVSSDVTSALGYTPVNKAGDSMSGNLAFGGTSKVIGLAEPTAAGDAATKNYVDSLVSGLSWKERVAAAVADHTAEAHAAGKRVLDLTDGKIYTSDGSAWGAGVAPVDGDAVFDAATETGYVYNGTAWTQFTGTGQIAAGVGLAKTGNVIDVNLGAGIAQLPSDEVGIDLRVGGGLMLTEDGSTSSTASGAQLMVKLDGATLASGTSGVKVADSGITATQIATSVAGDGLQGGAGSALAVKPKASLVAGEGAVNVTSSGVSVALGTGSNQAAAGDHVHGIDALNDVTITSAVAGQALVYNGSAFVNRAIYFMYDGASATSHVVSHNLGQRYVNVTVIDAATNEQIIPQSVTFDSANQLTVTLNTALALKVVCMGV
jgi:hypothetical protein